MITLKALLDGMAASGRPLTERAARDWWSKGLLPRPRRKGLGQGRGTETYWTDPRVPAQAEASYDLLALHARTYSVAAHLWLSGFPIELALVRGAYHRMLRAQNDPGKKVSAFAAQISRHLVRNGRIPRAIRDNLTDLMLPYLETFFSVGETFDEDELSDFGGGLSDLWAEVGPCLWDTKGAGAPALSDHQLGVAASYLSRMGSLTAQQNAILSASDYELIRARRLLLFVRGYIRRLADLSGPLDALDTHCRNFSIAMSRPAIPIFVMILREDWLRHRITGFLLDTAAKFRQRMQSGEFVTALARYKSGSFPDATGQSLVSQSRDTFGAAEGIDTDLDHGISNGRH